MMETEALRSRLAGRTNVLASSGVSERLCLNE